MLFHLRAALVILCLGVCGVLPTEPIQAADAVGPVYELRTYTCEPGKLPALHERFREHVLALLEKHGMKNLAYWTPVDEPAASNQLVYLLEHSSRQAADASWKSFLDDPEWKQVAEASAKAHGKILSKPPESVYLIKTDYSPSVPKAAADKGYELRIYTAPEGRLDDLNTRFRDHTVRLFRKHGMESYGYWVPLDSPASENTLIYLLEHSSTDSAAAGFAAFRADEEWVKARTESEKNGKLTAKPPESIFLKPTDYSPHR